MPKVQFTETVLRDANQSLIATRMKFNEFEPILAELDKAGTSTLVTRITSDMNQVQSGVNIILRLFLRSPFLVVGALVAAFLVNVRVAIIFLPKAALSGGGRPGAEPGANTTIITMSPLLLPWADSWAASPLKRMDSRLPPMVSKPFLPSLPAMAIPTHRILVSVDPLAMPASIWVMI